MPIERFTKAQFEAALPRHNKTDQPLWTELGLVDGEYCYLVAPDNSSWSIYVRSTVSERGVCADTGEDSIRILLVRTSDRKPIGSKIAKYVTRVTGWQKRLTDQLRALWALGKLTGPCHNTRCVNGWICIWRVHKEGPNKGRLFRKCTNNCGFHEWVNEEVKEDVGGNTARASTSKTAGTRQ